MSYGKSLMPLFGIGAAAVLLASCSSNGQQSNGTGNTATPTTSAAATGGAGVGKLFAANGHVCSAIDAAAINRATGVNFPAPKSVGDACFWQIPGTPTVVRISVHPGLTKTNVDAAVNSAQAAHPVTTPTTLPGASYAIVVASGSGNAASVSLYGVFPQGELIVSSSGPIVGVPQTIAAANAAIA
jgi:hypothetical protein